MNDLHAAIAYLGAGRGERLDELVAALQASAAGAADASRWARDIGLEPHSVINRALLDRAAGEAPAGRKSCLEPPGPCHPAAAARGRVRPGRLRRSTRSGREPDQHAHTQAR